MYGCESWTVKKAECRRPKGNIANEGSWRCTPGGLGGPWTAGGNKSLTGVPGLVLFGWPWGQPPPGFSPGASGGDALISQAWGCCSPKLRVRGRAWEERHLRKRERLGPQNTTCPVTSLSCPPEEGAASQCGASLPTGHSGLGLPSRYSRAMTRSPSPRAWRPDFPGKEMATHSSVLAWRIPGTGEPGGLPSMGSHMPGESQGRGSLVGCRLWGRLGLSGSMSTLRGTQTIPTHQSCHLQCRDPRCSPR